MKYLKPFSSYIAMQNSRRNLKQHLLHLTVKSIYLLQTNIFLLFDQLERKCIVYIAILNCSIRKCFACHVLKCAHIVNNVINK